MTPQHEAAIHAAVEALADAIVVAVRAETSPTSTPPDRLISVSEACHALSLSRSSLYSHFGSGPGQLQSQVVGRRRLIAASAIAQFIHESADGRAPTIASSRTRARP